MFGNIINNIGANFGSNGNINIGSNNVSMNGKTYTIPSCQSLSIVNGQIFVDGKKLEGGEIPEGVTIKIEGSVSVLDCDQSVVCGNVETVSAKGSVSCNSVGGDVQANGSVSCDDVKGNVTAGGSVNCDKVYGSVKAGGSINC